MTYDCQDSCFRCRMWISAGDLKCPTLDRIKMEERKKVLEWLCHHSTDYDLIDEHGMYVDSEDMQYGWNCKPYEAKTINNVLTDYEKWLKGETE